MAKVTIDKSGNRQHRDQHGWITRDDGPAMIYVCGLKIFVIDHIYHNAKGPARVFPNGYMEWYAAGDRIWPKL